MTIYKRITIVFFVVMLLMANRIHLHARPTIYSVGVVPQFDARVLNEVWQPILKKLSQKTTLFFDLKLSPSIPEFEKAFAAGEFDLLYLNPYHLIIANREQGYIPLVKDNGRKLYGIIVVRKDSSIQTIQELNGQTIAFPAPNALGAALIPRAEFAVKYHIRIIPKYVRSHTSVYLNVILKQAAAGGGVQSTLNQQKPEIQEKLRILHKTISVPPHPIAVHPRIPKNEREKIRSAFLAIGETEEGRALLKKIPINKIGLATLGEYNQLEELGLEKFYIQ